MLQCRWYFSRRQHIILKDIQLLIPSRPGLFGWGRSFLCFFLCCLLCFRARGGRQGAWLALKNVTMKGCLERGPRRPTKPTQPADNERSGRGKEHSEDIKRYHSPKLPFATNTIIWVAIAHQNKTGIIWKSLESVPDEMLTILRFYVQSDSQVASWLQEPVVAGRCYIEGQPSLLPCWNWLHVQQDELRFPEITPANSGFLKTSSSCTLNSYKRFSHLKASVVRLSLKFYVEAKTIEVLLFHECSTNYQRNWMIARVFLRLNTRILFIDFYVTMKPSAYSLCRTRFLFFLVKPF